METAAPDSGTETGSGHEQELGVGARAARPAAGQRAEGFRTGALILTAMVLIGSSTATAAKFAVADLPIPLLPLFRFGVAGLALWPWLGGYRQLRAIARADLGLLLLASFLAVPVNQGFFLNGTRLAPTTHVGLIYATCPLVVLVLALFLRQERLDLARALGIVATVAGAGFIAWGSLTQRRGGAEASNALLGDLLLVGAVTSWGGYVTLNKRLVGKYPSIAVLGATFLAGALMCVPGALWTAPDWLPSLAQTRPSAWYGLIYLTLVASVVGLACQNLALRRLDASHVAAVGNLSPVLTVLWGAWLLGEEVSVSLALGGVMCLVGVAIASRRWEPRRASRGRQTTLINGAAAQS